MTRLIVTKELRNYNEPRKKGNFSHSKTKYFEISESETNYLDFEKKQIKSNNRTIAYFIVYQEGVVTVPVIPGFVASEEYKDELGLTVRNIEEIVDPKMRKRIISRLREEEPIFKDLDKRAFNFW